MIQHLRLTPGAVAVSALVLTGICLPARVSAASDLRRSIALPERAVALQKIADVYARHRLDTVPGVAGRLPVSDRLDGVAAGMRAEDTLRKSAALESFWARPILRRQIQGELDRIARETRDAKRLGEIFQSLDNDPVLIAECLVRPILVDRFMRESYATDGRLHGALRSTITRALAAAGNLEDLASAGGHYSEQAWIRHGESGGAPRLDRPGISLDSLDSFNMTNDEWTRSIHRLRSLFPGGSDVDPLPVGTLSGLEETADGFRVSTILDAGADRLTLASRTWSKEPFEYWWKRSRERFAPEVPMTESYALPAIGSTACTPGIWSSLPMQTADPRVRHTTVWTGSEMIVWGGLDFYPIATGGRYDPATDTWVPTSSGPGVPVARYDQTAVWTGGEMIVWGGRTATVELQDGARYNPALDSWAPLPPTPSTPAGRFGHTAVWTGATMIVWGGAGQNFLDDGGVFNPATNGWSLIKHSDAGPEPRYFHTAVWTGKAMVVWGGYRDPGGGILSFPKVGGIYNPASGRWRLTSNDAAAPTGRTNHSAVWTGREMIVWGGEAFYAFVDTGARFDPKHNRWRPVGRTGPYPGFRSDHSAVWTGKEMIVWGGRVSAFVSTNTGARYDPVADTWSAVDGGSNAPAARASQSAIWTGSEMIVWGGEDHSAPISSGGRYDPMTDSWRLTGNSAGAPSPRQSASSVWTGSEWIIWGGIDSLGFLSSGARYDPATNTWSSCSSPATFLNPRTSHTAVWTGTEMIVWGGYDGVTLSFRNTGARYDPDTDQWAGIATPGSAVSPRAYQSAIWTGDEMIVWGGYTSPAVTDTGGAYDPASDSWRTTSIQAATPSGRQDHTALWTGTRMIVWGGADGANPLPVSGALYDPASDSWTPLGSGGSFLPGGRFYHQAIWTGTELIVWGGYDFSSLHQDGARINPTANAWSPLPITPGTPSARERAGAVWTGQEMIVWGGETSFPFTFFSDGSGYDPSSNSWRILERTGAVASPRAAPQAVYTGTQMLVWGGFPYTGSGAGYCPSDSP